MSDSKPIIFKDLISEEQKSQKLEDALRETTEIAFELYQITSVKFKVERKKAAKVLKICKDCGKPSLMCVCV